jgi:cytochrome c peroxidase
MATPTAMTLEEAVKLGEYEPEFLSRYPEWSTLSRFVQFQKISQAIENRKRFLMQKWAEVINFMDENDDPKLREEAKKGIESQLAELRKDKEKLYWEYLKEG